MYLNGFAQNFKHPVCTQRKDSFYGALISLDGDFSRLDVEYTPEPTRCVHFLSFFK